MKPGQLDVAELDKPYVCVVQLKHQQPGVVHQVLLHPDKIKQTMRRCSLGEWHKSALIAIGQYEGDQAAGWQYPENIYVLTVLGEAVEKDGHWVCKPLAG